MLKTTVEITILIFRTAISQLILLQSVSNFLGMFFIVLPREGCLKILIKVLVNFLCYVEILEIFFFTIIYVLCHKNLT